MELIILILQAMSLFIAPDMTQDEIKVNYPDDYKRAEIIIETNAYRIDEKTGIVIVDDGVDD